MTKEKGFIKITNGRWWYEDKVGQILRIDSEIENYADEALAKPERAFEVIDEEHGYCRVLARDCVDWTLPKPVSEEESEKKRDFVGDAVEHPNHYTSGKFEAIEVIEDVTAGYEDGYVAYCVGNTQKYIKRAPFKHADNGLEDLRKAKKYLEFAIRYIEKNEN
jgi:hypothetical protein